MQAIEFETRLQDGVIHLPALYRNWRDNHPVKVILLAADHEAQTTPLDATQRLCAILEIGRLCAAAPELDPRSADEIIGYDAMALKVTKSACAQCLDFAGLSKPRPGKAGRSTPDLTSQAIDF